MSIVLLAVVEPEAFGIQIAEKMERLNRNMRPFDALVEERPEVFEAVRVDVAFCVALRMVDYLVSVFRVQADKRCKRIGEYFGPFSTCS